jgi:uncharacterized phage protein (TIGR02218 family)
MSFDARERSVALGEPVLLIEFGRGPLVWRYTNAGRDYDIGGTVYKDVPGLTGDSISQTGEVERDTVKLTVPPDLEIIKHYVGTKPSTRTRAVLRTCHFGETEAPVQWIGYIVGMRLSKSGQREIACQSMQATFDRPGLRLCWSRGCPYAVFDDQCGVNPDDFKVAGQLTVLDGQRVTSAALAGAPEADYYVGGMIRWMSADGIQESRGLDAFDATTGVASVYGGTLGMATGQAATFHPGCGYTTDVCNDRFDNLVNCGAHGGMPGKSPFDGTDAF